MTTARTKHVPMRRCVVCRTSRPPSQLLRFARDDAGAWRLDPARRAGGRGAWVCREARCHELKALGRGFRSQAPQVHAQLKALDEEANRNGTSQDGGIDV